VKPNLNKIFFLHRNSLLIVSYLIVLVSFPKKFLIGVNFMLKMIVG